MILELSVENFLSIKERLVISFEASASGHLPQNLIDSDGQRLLKSLVIYGPNASGKTNIIRAMLFMWQMVTQSHGFNVDVKIPCSPFKLDATSANKPSKFELIFRYEDIKYKYGFACTNECFVDEYLYSWPNGRETLIFQRTKTKEFDFHSDKSQQEALQKQTTDNVLYLSRATQLGYQKTRSVYEFFANALVVNFSPSWRNITVKMLHEDPEFRKKIIRIFQKADFGCIQDITVTKEMKPIEGVELLFSNKQGVVVNPLNNKEQEFYDVKFTHKTNEGKLVDFSPQEESAGTNKALSLLGPFFDILENGKVAFIDEMESSLHPYLTRFLVKLFNSKINKKKAQLVFTTHDTSLLKNDLEELFRRDQIYICSKDNKQVTQLSSYLDFELRESSDFERAYLNGRVGGLPFIDETLFDDEW